MNYKKSYILILVISFLLLVACKNVSDSYLDTSLESTEVRDEQTDVIYVESTTIQIDTSDLVGPWYALERSDSSMEIRSNGQISFHVGQNGGYGNYTVDGNILTANMTDYDTDATYEISMEIITISSETIITMEFNGETVSWTQNDSTINSTSVIE